MSRTGFTRAGALAVSAAGVLAAAVIGSAAASGDTAPPPRDLLRSFACQKALDPPGRSVSIQAVMRPVTGTAKMQMRFDLMRRTRRDAPFRLVRGRLLGSWITPQNASLGQRPGDVWIVNHPVVNLLAPATYHFRVSFRWLDSNGRQLSSAVLLSSNCFEPELRADLLVRSLTATSLPSGKDAYVAVIGNRGLTAAGPVEVDLAGAGNATQAQTLSTVGPRSSARQRFVAPACAAGDSLTVTVDPSHTIDESNFANNTLTIPCLAPSTSG
jgi:hypothetical protein